MPDLSARILAVSSVDPASREAMYGLLARYYDDTDRQRFHEDLSRKDHVIVLRDRHGGLRGFSTLQRLVVEVDGVRHRGVYSGDTVVDQAGWGQGVLGRAFLRYLLVARARHPLSPLWWFLISKGYKTYLLMANNFAEHWPRHELPTPRWADDLRLAFGRALFGDLVDAESLVIRFPQPAGRVRDGVAVIDDELRAREPRVRFFERQNPGWQRGDELICVARMSWTLPFAYAWKKTWGSR